MQKRIRGFAYYFIIIFIPVLLIIAIFSFTVFYSRYTSSKANLISSQVKELDILQNEIEFTLGNIVTDLSILSKGNAFKKYINEKTNAARSNVEDVFGLICSERGTYNQIRYLDSSGKEIIRVNYSNGKTTIVRNEDLQNKGNRYYFKDTFNLNKGDVFFSPLDLNIENGKVDIPEKPVIRIGTPVFDNKGVKQGIILLNYFGDNIINIISKRETNKPVVYSLLNRDSYWLYSKNIKQNWGFMFENRKNLNFKNFYPGVWEKMLNSDINKLKTEQGFFIYKTVYPLKYYMFTSTGAGTAYGSSKTVNEEEYFWKIVAFIPEKLFVNLVTEILLSMRLLLFIIFGSALVISVLLSKLWIVQKTAEQNIAKNLKDKELLLREIHHRVKNSLSIVSSFIGLYSSSFEDEKNNFLFDGLRQKIETISLVHTYLYQSSDIEHITLSDYLETLVQHIINELSFGIMEITPKFYLLDIKLTAKITITLGLIISELTMNSLKHAFPDKPKGTISIKSFKDSENLVIVYSDNGQGLPEDYVINNSDSLGMGLIDSLVMQLKGELIISTGIDSSFTIRFPVGNLDQAHKQ